MLREARERAGRSPAECARLLDLSPGEWEAAEAGERAFALPDLEALSLYLDVPLATLWGGEPFPPAPAVDYAAFRQLRAVIVGALLRQARQEAGQTADEIAAAAGLTPESLEAAERGAAPIALPELEKVAAVLGVPLSYFQEDEHGPLARREAERKLLRRLDELAPEARQLVAAPVNQGYLDVAVHLSGLDAQRLRAIAESLLEITY
jgi:transcriptional regulator with XRE-family HTH domain